MANPDHVVLVRQGAAALNRFGAQNASVGTDLTNASWAQRPEVGGPDALA